MNDDERMMNLVTVRPLGLFQTLSVRPCVALPVYNRIYFFIHINVLAVIYSRFIFFNEDYFRLFVDFSVKFACKSSANVCKQYCKLILRKNVVSLLSRSDVKFGLLPGQIMLCS